MRAALGVVDLDVCTDLDEARRSLRRIAGAYDLDVVDVLTFRPCEVGWIWRLLETVHKLSVHTVVVEDISELHEQVMAVTGVADLRARHGFRPYLGYGSGFTRPSMLAVTR